MSSCGRRRRRSCRMPSATAVSSRNSCGWRPASPMKRPEPRSTLPAARLALAYPATDRGRRAELLPFGSPGGRDASMPLLVLLSTALLVLLVATLNVAALSLARGIGRLREASLRVALGAGRARLVRLHLIESGLVTIGGVALGLAFASILLDLLKALHRVPAACRRRHRWSPAAVRRGARGGVHARRRGAAGAAGATLRRRAGAARGRTAILGSRSRPLARRHRHCRSDRRGGRARRPRACSPKAW